MTEPAAPNAARKGPGFPEFVCLIAFMMALNALAIDSMLPALPAIGEALGVARDNDRQWVVTAYVLGFGMAQLVYGPLADRYGRKPVLMVSLGLYAAFSAMAAFAPTFETLLIARVATGIGAAATRVLAVSIVRDRYVGRTMARVMSLSFLVFLGVPILAPTLGTAVLAAVPESMQPWRWIFGVLAAAGGAYLAWAAIRLPETQDPANRVPIQVARIAASFGEALRSRQGMGYTLAMTAITGALFGFIGSAQQIFFDVFGAGDRFALAFGVMASGVAAASLLNASLVERFGSRLLSHGALIGFILTGAIHASVAWAGLETIWTFGALQTLTMFCFGLIAGNFGAMAMEPMGRIAGTASALQGFVSSTFGALLGFAIGQGFDGTTRPFATGLTVMGLMAMACVLWAEGGRLFTARNPAPAAAQG